MEFGRREFLGALAAASAVSGCTSVGACGGDENISVFLSDLHVEGAQPTYKYSKERLEKTVGEILAMSPRPGRVVCFGDIACSYGLEADYVEAKRILSRIENAGIALYFTLGNHDRRSFFFDKWPRCAAASQVPGRCVSVVDLGSADLVLLDALKGTDDRALNDMGPVEGGLDDRQLEWFEDFVKKASRPFFVGSHQFVDLYVKGEKPVRRAAKSRYFAGWIYGHDHEWLPSMRVCDWGKEVVKPVLCLPSSGLWGDIGYVIFRTSAKGAEAELVMQDFYFSVPRPASERPAFWDARIGDKKGARVRFTYS
jgi:hypothetical protein